ncbi:hypothetical protein J4466_02535 [Candidatus Pacearchaeota archaeon]|nr:hypothetical protein [Candidatus Pacearchaeota archaeon]
MDNQKTGIKIILIIITIVIPIMLIIMWLGFGTITNSSGEKVEMTLFPKTIISIGGLIIIILGWIQFKHQQNRDIKNAPRNN